MTTYRAIASTETDPEAPITSSLMKAFQQNVLAIAECDSSAPSTLFSSVLLGTIATTSGSTQTLSGLVLTPYRHLFVYFQNVGGSGSTGVASLLFASCVIHAPGTASYSSVRGRAIIDLNTGVGDCAVTSLSTAAPSSATVSSAYILRTSLSTASTSISVSVTTTGITPAFTGGSVLIYGVK